MTANLFLVPIETLYYYDGPMIFTAVVEGAERLLSVTALEIDCNYYVACTITEAELELLKDNELPVFDAFQKGPLYEVTEHFENGVSAKQVDVHNPNNLAKPGVFLYPRKR